MIKLIACDIDGTLLNSAHQLSPRNADVLRAAMEQGIKVVLATGRARTTTTVAIIEQLGLTTPGIYVQGTLVQDATGKIIHSITLPADAVRQMISLFAAEEITVLAYVGDHMYCREHNHFTDYVVEKLDEARPEAIGDLMSLADQINKMVVWVWGRQMVELRMRIQSKYGDRVKLLEALPQSLLADDAPAALEFLPQHANKGTALERVATDYGIQLSEIIALGDGENDIELVQSAGIGIAMANAHPKTKAIADHITLSNDEDGVAVALEKFVLNQRT